MRLVHNRDLGVSTRILSELLTGIPKRTLRRAQVSLASRQDSDGIAARVGRTQYTGRPFALCYRVENGMNLTRSCRKLRGVRRSPPTKARQGALTSCLDKPLSTRRHPTQRYEGLRSLLNCLGVVDRLLDRIVGVLRLGNVNADRRGLLRHPHHRRHYGLFDHDRGCRENRSCCVQPSIKGGKTRVASRIKSSSLVLAIGASWSDRGIVPPVVQPSRRNEVRDPLTDLSRQLQTAADKLGRKVGGEVDVLSPACARIAADQVEVGLL